MTDESHSRNMTFYSSQDAPTIHEDGCMTYAEVAIEPEVFEQVDMGRLMAGELVKVLFKGEGESGFSLIHAKFSPGYRLPRHSHSSDCLYYVVAGEAHLGSRVLKPGDGFFVRAEAPYTYNAGPEGVEVLEFRLATAFDIKIRDTTLAQWKPVADAINSYGEQWSESTEALPV